MLLKKIPRHFSLLLKYMLESCTGSWGCLSRQKQERQEKSLACQEAEGRGGDGKICLYGKLALFHLVLGLAAETQVQKIPFEPGPNEAQGSWLFLQASTCFLEKRKLERGIQEPGLFFFFTLRAPSRRYGCLCWRGFWNTAGLGFAPKLSRLHHEPLCRGCREPSVNVLLATDLWNLWPFVSPLRQSCCAGATF